MPRRVTIQMVADKAGCSPTTVSLALRGDERISGATKEMVWEIAEELGYVSPALTKRKAVPDPKVIGVVGRFELGLHQIITRDIVSAAQKDGFDVIIKDVDLYPRPIDALESMYNLLVKTVIVIEPNFDHVPARYSPQVVIGQEVDRDKTALVSTVHKNGCSELMAHLRKYGHRHVIYLDSPFSPAAAQRLKALEGAAAENNIEMTVKKGGNTVTDGYDSTVEMLSELWNENARSGSFVERRGELGQYTAILCYNDDCAEGAYIAMLKAGLSVPGDISLAAFGDTELGKSKIFSLTSVGLNHKETARLACQEAKRIHFKGFRRGGVIEVPTFLVERSSTGPANFLIR